MVQVGEGFLGKLLGPLIKTNLPLIGNILKPLAKSVLELLGLASATDTAIQNKYFGSGMKKSLISKHEKNYIMKIVKKLEDSRLFIKGISDTIKNEAKKHLKKTWISFYIIRYISFQFNFKFILKYFKK